MTRRARTDLSDLWALRLDWDALAVLTLLLASFALYARTAVPGVLDGDGGEFQTNIYKLGVSHTGYPLYFLLAKLWTLVMAAGTIAYRANVFSGFFGALTLVLIYFLARTLTERRAVALLTAALFGLSRVQWSQAIIPDVYTLNSFFLVLVLWLAIQWRAGRVPLWWVALAYGFSLSHHRTMILIAPALVFYVLLGAGRSLFKPRTLLVNGAALFLPLLLYLYIPLRGTSDVGVEYHPGNNVNIFALNAFYDLRFGPPGFLWGRITQTYLPLLIEQFTPLGFAAGLVGAGALANKRTPRGFLAGLPPRQLLLLIGLAHLGSTAFAICFWVFDSEIFFIPSYLTFLPFVAVGAALLCDALDARIARVGWRLAAEGLVLAALAAACVYLALVNWPRNDQSGNDEADTRWQAILAQPLEPHALFVAPWEDLTPLEYYQYVTGTRTDLERDKVVLNADQLKLAPQGNIAAEVRRALAQGQHVYLTRHPDETETLKALDAFELVPYATLWRVQERAPKGTEAVRTFGAGDEVQRWSAAPVQPRAGDFVTVATKWSADAPVDNTRLVLRLRDVAGKLWTERESVPYAGHVPEANDRNARDLQGIFVPPDAPPGHYTLEFASFERNGQAPLPLTGNSNLVTQTLQVTAPGQPVPTSVLNIPRRLTANVGSVQFLGYGVDTLEPRGGDRFEFDSWWQGLAPREHSLDIRLSDANGVETVLYRGALLPAASEALQAAQIVRARQALTIPLTAAVGYAQIMLSLDERTLPPIQLTLRASNRSLTAPEVPAPQAARLGDAIRLIGYKLAGTAFHAGDALPVTLFWNAAQTPPTSYKVFVHLVDANGVLRAQQDAVPQNGGLPTNLWLPGEYVTDPYLLSLPRDLAPGEYHLQVGMYDETTGTRLPLTDVTGARMPDDAVMLNSPLAIR